MSGPSRPALAAPEPFVGTDGGAVVSWAVGFVNRSGGRFGGLPLFGPDVKRSRFRGHFTPTTRQKRPSDASRMSQPPKVRRPYSEPVTLHPVPVPAPRHQRTEYRSSPSYSPPAPTTAKRRDIQALRALAVGAVVLNHLWPLRLPGGYVGVDVFFVISGFLISGHLVREVSVQGRLRFLQFYAHRALRLLPAAFLVIAVSLVGTYALLPHTQWSENSRQLFASAVYVENWVLAARSVNYMAAGEAATTAQHYWSLSVEEQFYLLWPVLLAGAAALARRRSTPRVRSALLSALTVVGLISFVYCVWITSNSPSQAYFVTPSRVWEFSLGGLLALYTPGSVLARRYAESLALAGFAAIVLCTFAFGPTTSFPGPMALIPTMGAALVILAGTGQPRLLHDRLTGLSPIQYVGDTSYSIYLWHWPLIVFAPFALSRDLTTLDKIALLAISLTLAAATRHLVEEPGRRWRWAHRRPSRTFVAMSAIVLLIGAGSWSVLRAQDARTAALEQQAERALSSDCAGPRAFHDESCPAPFEQPVANPAMTDANHFGAAPENCIAQSLLKPDGRKNTTVCDFSGGDPNATTVWLVGDSHATQWRRAILPLAEENSWRLTLAAANGCPPVVAGYVGMSIRQVPQEEIDACNSWNHGLADHVAKDNPDLVILSSYARQELLDDETGRSQEEQYVDGLQQMWTQWQARGIEIVVVTDPPYNDLVRSEDCLILHADDPAACAAPIAMANPPDPMVAAARSLPGIHVIDMTEYFCDADRCYAAAGGVALYYNAFHINGVYAELLAPYFAAELVRLVPSVVARHD